MSFSNKSKQKNAVKTSGKKHKENVNFILINLKAVSHNGIGSDCCALLQRQIQKMSVCFCLEKTEIIFKQSNELTIVFHKLSNFNDYWVDAKVSADFLKNVFKRCSATMDAWFSCI